MWYLYFGRSDYILVVKHISHFYDIITLSKVIKLTRFSDDILWKVSLIVLSVVYSKYQTVKICQILVTIEYRSHSVFTLSGHNATRRYIHKTCSASHCEYLCMFNVKCFKNFYVIIHFVWWSTYRFVHFRKFSPLSQKISRSCGNLRRGARALLLLLLWYNVSQSETLGV